MLITAFVTRINQPKMAKAMTSSRIKTSISPMPTVLTSFNSPSLLYLVISPKS